MVRDEFSVFRNNMKIVCNLVHLADIFNYLSACHNFKTNYCFHDTGSVIKWKQSL